MTTTKTIDILFEVIFPLFITIGFILMSLKAEIHIDRGSANLPFLKTKRRFGFGYASNRKLFGQVILTYGIYSDWGNEIFWLIHNISEDLRKSIKVPETQDDKNMTSQVTRGLVDKVARKFHHQYQVANMLIPDIHKPAPPFSGSAVVDGQFKEVSLSMFQSKYLVLLFYPLDFTFVCPTELIAYSDRLNEFRESECEVVAVSTDSEYCHLAWANVPKEDGGLAGVKVPLLSDKSTKISRAYGVLDEETGTAFRGLFIIDDRSLVRQVTINDLQVGRSVDETLRLVQAFRHVDKYGEVCPAGWRPGNPAISIEENRRSSSKSNKEDGVGEGTEGSLIPSSRPSSRSSSQQSQQSYRASELSGSL